MKKKLAALLLAGTLAVAPSYAVLAEDASATEAPAEEKKEPVKNGSYDLKCSEDDKDEDAIKLHFSNEVRNDVTGNCCRRYGSRSAKAGQLYRKGRISSVCTIPCR